MNLPDFLSSTSEVSSADQVSVSVYQLYVTTKLTNKMNNNAFLVKVLQVVLTCNYLPIIQTEIAFVRGLQNTHYE